MRISDWSSDVCSSDLLALVAAQVEDQQRRRVADAVDRDHHAPLDLGGALEELLRIAAEHRQRRQRKECVDRDEDREQAIPVVADQPVLDSEEHTSELQSLMRISYAVFCLKKKTT